ncbi:trypsin-like serine peptidase [Streptacidiphilus cavernicola]|uniref:Serine protease n=1 Tax=Streptacidiphilus cavernicola TaxID=3342716 RepID=A0ABV6VVU6_9ACTN
MSGGGGRGRGGRPVLWSATTALVLAAALTPLAAPRAAARPAVRPAARFAARPAADSEAAVRREPSPGAAAVAEYWTAARMAAATAEDVGGKDLPLPRSPAPSAVSPSVAGIPSAYPNGRPSIGVLFFRGRDLRAHFCTAFVVASRTRNLVMTAAHCGPGSSQAFVPGYRIHGRTPAPYGIWPVLRSFTDRRFRRTGGGTDFDYAFAKVARSAAGRQVEDLTHGNTLTVTPAFANRRVGVTGYPRASAAPLNRPVTCWAPTRRLGARRQMVFLCDGYYGGTSGSPWLIGYRAGTNTGRVIGLIGGVGGGGPNAWTSYSPMFDKNTLRLYAFAVAH